MRVETLIVGAGPAGLAVGACLRRAGRELAIVEREHAIAASWRRHYDRLHLHTVKQHSALPFRPFPADEPQYVPRAHVVAYLEEYARAFELVPELGVEVARAEPLPDEAGWRVETSAGVRECRFLVIATGYNRAPHRPTLPDEERFGGTLLHSAAYTSAAPFAGRRVLVIGLGNTGGELALDLVEHGATVDISVRGPLHVVPRDPFAIPAQVLALATAWIPPAARDPLLGLLAKLTVGDLSRWGLRAPDEGILAQLARTGRIPLIDIGTIALVKAGRIGVRPDVRALTATGARFADDAVADYDAIILATGYRPRLAELLPTVGDVLDERGLPRVSGRESARRGLYFVGFNVPITGMLREIGREARRVASAIARASDSR